MRPLPHRAVLGRAEVRELLPHREPMVFVDRVVGLRTEPDPALTAEHDVALDNPVFAAHFPGRPIWPGAFVVEGLAQSAHLLLLLCAHDASRPPQGTGVLTDIAVRLSHPVPPGVTLSYRVDLMGTFGASFRVAVEARIGRTSVARGTLAVALLNTAKDGASP